MLPETTPPTWYAARRRVEISSNSPGRLSRSLSVASTMETWGLLSPAEAEYFGAIIIATAGREFLRACLEWPLTPHILWSPHAAPGFVIENFPGPSGAGLASIPGPHEVS